jgi:hypothetical protein
VRGFVGLVIGLVLGAGAMYLVLRPPWAGGAAPVVDAGVVATAKPDAGAKPRGKHPRSGGGGHTPRPGNDSDPHLPTIDDQFGPDDPTPAAPQPQLVALTATDRALEWRGDAVTLPPQKIDLGAGTEARALDQGEIEQTTSSQGGGVRDCVVHGVTNTDLQGTITVQMLVDGSGRVTRTRIQAPRYLLDHGLYDCTQRAASRMHFPAVGGATIVTLPVTLS